MPPRSDGPAENHFILSVLAVIFCFPLGLVAIILSYKVGICIQPASLHLLPLSQPSVLLSFFLILPPMLEACEGQTWGAPVGSDPHIQSL